MRKDNEVEVSRKVFDRFVVSNLPAKIVFMEIIKPNLMKVLDKKDRLIAIKRGHICYVDRGLYNKLGRENIGCKVTFVVDRKDKTQIWKPVDFIIEHSSVNV